MPAAIREEFQSLMRAIAKLPPRVKAAAATQRPAYQLCEVDEQVLDALMEHGASLASEIGERIGRSSQAMNARLGRLEKNHLVQGVIKFFKQTSRKEWTITDKGRQAAITPNPEVWQAKGA